MKKRSIPMNVFFKSQFSYHPLVRISHNCANSKKNRLHECCLEIIYFGKESSLLCNFIEIAHRHGCSPLNLLHIFRTPFSRSTSRWLLLNTPEINKEVLVFSFISVIQAELNEFMRIWNCHKMKKQDDTPVRVSEIIFNVPAVSRFPKDPVIIIQRDTKIEEIFYIELYLTFKVKLLLQFLSIKQKNKLKNITHQLIYISPHLVQTFSLT